MQFTLVDPYTADAERIWRDLEAASQPAYFLTWAWIESWLACLPRAEAPRLAVIGPLDAPVAAFFLGRRAVVRHRVMPIRGLFFNTSGVARFDKVFVEYNALVGRHLPLAELLPLLPRGWDELSLPGLRADAFADLETLRDVHVIAQRTPAYYVDLAKARAKNYLSLVSGQTRSQIRRAQREAGNVTVEVARDLAHAIDIYGELGELHGEQWRRRGKPGAFADPWFDRFHRRLIAARFRHGEIQLLRARGEDGTIGCLYNFVHRGRVLQYQSGFAAFDNEKLKPGFICHAAAIEHAIAHGHDVYDFLGGDQRYKKQLATDFSTLVWARVQQPRLRFVLEDQLQRWVGSLRDGGDGS